MSRRWTLSHHFWRWFAIGKPWSRHLAGLRWVILTGFLVSLTLHFVAFLSVAWLILFGAGCVWSIWYYHKREAPWHGVHLAEKIWLAILGVLVAWEITSAFL